MLLRRSFLAAAAAGAATGCSRLKSMLPYQNPKLAIDKRVEDLLARLTLEERLGFLNGAGWMTSRGNARLGVPPIRMTDGPVGIRNWAGPGDPESPPAPAALHATAFPAGIALAATWNPDLATQQGRALGQQALALGRDQILGPTVNIQRTPFWGRNFEGFGEDPWLTSRIAVAWISGVQERGVIATIKHFAVNNQEFRRNSVDVRIDERALQEIYLPAFQAAVEEAGIWCVMSAYNKVNGAFCAENPHLLTDILRKKWGFKGFVISDWAGTHNTENSVNAGLDLEMPSASSITGLVGYFKDQPGGNPGFDGGYLTRDKLKPLLASGKISQDAVDESVRRILRATFAMGLFERQRQTDGRIDTPADRALARTVAVQSLVLLKNERALLPIGKDHIRTLAVLGPNADVNQTGGGGSSEVTPAYSSKPLDAIRERAGAAFKVEYAREGREAVDLAARADIAIIFAGNNGKIETEFTDRKTLDLPPGQDELIENVVKANPRTIVVLNAGAPVTMSKWLQQVPAVLIAWFPGQEGGHAIADVLFGDATPSGKLPVTFPRRAEDTSAFGHYPGENDQVSYDEGIFVGYRHFDKAAIEPLFPFGHGLSYTTFEYSDLRIYPRTPRYGQLIEVMLKVRNTGPRAGAEVIQCYVHDVKCSVERPRQELKGFKRVEFRPGETKDVLITLDQRALSFYDPIVKEWATEPGEFEVFVGSSSRDIRLKGSFELFE